MKQKPTAYFPNLVLEEGSISSQVYYAVRKAIYLLVAGRALLLRIPFLIALIPISGLKQPCRRLHCISIMN